MEENQNIEKSEISIEQLQEQIKQRDAQLEDLKGQFIAVKSKADELLDEAKKAKRLKAEAEEMAKKQAEEKAKKNGDYEQLLKSSEQQRQELAQRLEALQSNISKEKITNTALKVASELADGSNAEILSEFIARRLKYTEEGIKITDDKGELTVSTLDDLKNEFSSSGKFKALLRGTKATGGGAQGAGDSVAKSKTMKRADFEKLNPLDKAQFMKNGGTLTDS